MRKCCVNVIKLHLHESGVSSERASRVRVELRRENSSVVDVFEFQMSVSYCLQGQKVVAIGASLD